MSQKSRSGSQAERRAHPRYAEPVLAVTIGDKTFQTENWSMAGMVLEKYKGSLSVGAIFDVASIARASEKDSPVKVKVSGRVTRSEKEGGILAFNFLELDDTAFKLLQDCMAERMRLLGEEATNY